MTLVNVDTGEVVNASAWADKIRPHLHQSVASIIEAGQLLIEAKAELPHGQFGPMLADLGLGEVMAQRFMRVASHPVLSNPSSGTGLPPSINVLDELTRVPEDELLDAIDNGTVGPSTTRTQAKTLRDRDPEHAAIEDELRDALGDDISDEDRLDALDDNAESKRIPDPPKKRDVGGGLHHPAPYSDALLALFRDLLGDLIVVGEPILDPFAGTGRIHELRPTYETTGIEIETEWAALSPHTVLGNALALPTDWTDEFAAIVTSPTYGNRLADSHNASDPGRRRSYTHDLGRPLDVDNSGAMQWGSEYRFFHRDAWKEAVRCLADDGLFLLNIKDHIRDGNRQQVSRWHIKALESLGLEWEEEHEVPTRGLMAGANHELRAGGEKVYVLRKVAS